MVTSVVVYGIALLLVISLISVTIAFDQSPRFARYKWLVEPVLLPLGATSGIVFFGTLLVDLAAMNQMKEAGVANPPVPSSFAIEHGMYGHLLLYASAVLLAGFGVIGVFAFGLKVGTNVFSSWREFYFGRIITLLFILFVIIGASVALLTAASIVRDVKQQVPVGQAPAGLPGSVLHRHSGCQNSATAKHIEQMRVEKIKGVGTR